MPPHDDNEYASRMERLETIVESLSKSFAQFRDETRRDIEKFASALGSHGKTSWPLVVSILVLTLGIGGAMVAFIVMQTDPIRERIERDEGIAIRDNDRLWLDLQETRERLRWLESGKFASEQGDQLRDRISTLEGMLTRLPVGGKK